MKLRGTIDHTVLSVGLQVERAGTERVPGAESPMGEAAGAGGAEAATVFQSNRSVLPGV